jgi:hypothetical protein
VAGGDYYITLNNYYINNNEITTCKSMNRCILEASFYIQSMFTPRVDVKLAPTYEPTPYEIYPRQVGCAASVFETPFL